MQSIGLRRSGREEALRARKRRVLVRLRELAEDSVGERSVRLTELRGELAVFMCGWRL